MRQRSSAKDRLNCAGAPRMSFAKREDVEAQLEAVFVEFGKAGGVALFEERAAFARVERLQPRASAMCRTAALHITRLNRAKAR
jgi:hypothetical protein